MGKNFKRQNFSKGSTIYEIIAGHYYELKDIAVRESKKFNNGYPILDEDIFHNVLLAMAERLGNCGYFLTLKQVKGYFCNSFKNALCREVLYARNKYNSSNFEECMFKTKNGDIDTRIDYETLLCEIERKYPKQEYNIFIDFISGFKLRELNEKYNISNSEYIVRKIKDFVKNEYPELKITRKKEKKT